MAVGKDYAWVNYVVVFGLGILQFIYVIIVSRILKKSDKRGDVIHDNEIRSIKNETEIKNIKEKCKIRHEE